MEIKDDQITNPDWASLIDVDKQSIQKTVLESFIKENDSIILPKVTECLIQVASNVFNIAPSDQMANVWPEIISFAINSLSIEPNETNLAKLESGIRLFEGIYGFIYQSLSNSNNSNQIKSLVDTVSVFLKAKNLSLASKAVKTLSEMSFYSNKKEIKWFKDLILPIMTVTYSCFNEGKENELKACCKAIIEMSTESVSFLFKNHFTDLFILMGKIIEKKSYEDENIRELGFEVIVNLIESKPKYLSSDNDKLKLFIELLYKYALSMEPEITTEWATPTQDSYFDEEFIYEKEVAAAVSFIERLIDAIGNEVMLPLLSEYISKLLENTSDWRIKYVGIMSYKQIITHVDDMVSVDSIFAVIFENLKNDNAKIRYSCLSTIEELGDTFKPYFSDKYAEELIPKILDSFTDSVLKVQLEACEALNTIMSNSDEEMLANFTEKILEKTFQIFLMEGVPNNLRECLLNVVATLVSQIAQLFSPYSNKCLGLICDFFSKSYTQKLYKPLYGNLIECITLIGPFDKEIYYKLVPELVDAIIEIQNSIHLSSDPLRDYLQDAIERLTRVLKTDFQHLLPKLFESIMKLVRTIPEMSVSSNPESTFKIDDLLNSATRDPNEVKIKYETKAKTASTEEMASALETLNKVIEVLDELYIPFIDLTNKEIFFYLTYLHNEDIRQIASDSIPLLLRIIKKKSDKSALIEYAKLYTTEMMKSVEKEFDNETLGYQLENFVDLVETAEGYLNKDEVNLFFEKILIVFDDVEKRRLKLNEKKSTVENSIIQKKTKGKHHSGNEEEDSDEDEERVEKEIADEINDIEDIQSQMSELIGKLFATHKNDSQDVVGVIINKMIPKYFRTDASVFENKMGMYLIDDIVEYLGQDYIHPDIWSQMAQALITYSTHDVDSLRQPALYGLGIFAQNCKTGFEKYTYECISKIYQALSIASNDRDQEDWGLARDNAVAALGRIIQFQHNNVKTEDLPLLIQKWLSGLPINTDESEMVGQHTFLCDILLNKPDLIVGKDYENGVDIVKVLSRVYKSKYSEEKVDEKIKQVTETLLKTNERFKEICESLSKSEDEKIAKRVKKLFLE